MNKGINNPPPLTRRKKRTRSTSRSKGGTRGERGGRERGRDGGGRARERLREGFDLLGDINFVEEGGGGEGGGGRGGGGRGEGVCGVDEEEGAFGDLNAFFLFLVLVFLGGKKWLSKK